MADSEGRAEIAQKPIKRASLSKGHPWLAVYPQTKASFSRMWEKEAFRRENRANAAYAGMTDCVKKSAPQLVQSPSQVNVKMTRMLHKCRPFPFYRRILPVMLIVYDAIPSFSMRFTRFADSLRETAEHGIIALRLIRKQE